MESALRHIGNLIPSGDGTAGVYLHALDEHINANTSQRDINHVLETTNFLLSKAKTRKLGMEVLIKILPWINQEVLEQKIPLWTSFILKACDREVLQRNGGIIYNTLTNIIEVLRQYAELSKTFGSNHLTKIYECITLSPGKYTISALKCAEACLKTYSKPSGQNREAMERFLMRFVDRFDDETNHWVGRCLHYLQLTTVPGSKDLKAKEQWKGYQLTLIDGLAEMIDEAYAENNRSVDGEKKSTKFAALKLSADPNTRAAQLFVRFHNINNYLKIALCEPNLQAYKPVLPKRILNLITRGLVVTCAALNRENTYSKVAFGVFLPKIQLGLLDLCKALIRVLQCHLRIHYKSLLSCLLHVLKSTTSSNATIRAEVYEIITLWCQTLNEGSRCELYADELVPEILKDLTPAKNELVSQMKTNNKPKKPYKPLQSKEIKLNALDKQNKTIFLAPIKCLKALLHSCANFLKPTTMTLIQTCVLKISASFLVSKRSDAYNNWRNRLEMYSLLKTLLMTPNQHSPPATEIILCLLQTAQTAETNSEIRKECGQMIAEVEKIVHPQKESLIIPIEARAIRNAFSRLGQETLLEQSHDSIAALRFKFGDKEANHLTDHPHKPGAEEHDQQMEAEIPAVNGTDKIIECESTITEHSYQEIFQRFLPKPTESKAYNGSSNEKSRRKMSTQSDDDDSANEIEAKRSKVESSPTESQSSGDDEFENSPMDADEDDLRPVAPVNGLRKTDPNERVQSNGDPPSTVEQDDNDPKEEKQSKNEADEMAEMEACFVDELKSF